MQHAFEEKIFKNVNKLSKEQLIEFFSQECGKRREYQNILDAISYAVLALDAAGRIRYTNPACKKYLRMPLEKSIDRDILGLPLDPHLKAELELVIKKSGRVVNKEMTLTQPIVSIVSLSAFTIAEKGHILGHVFVIDDVTEIYNKKLREHHEKSIASLGLLTAGVAHEIKNPLGSLDLHIQLIRRFIKQRKILDKDELEELVRVVDDEIKRLDRIVNDFLFSVRPIKPVLKPEDLNSLLAEVLKVLKPEIEEKGITLNVDFADGLPIIPLDRNYIKQAVLNILQNAIYSVMAAARPGVLDIQTFQENEKIVLVLSDNGKGISRENMNKIFEPFFSTKKMGTGLGLTIVYKIIHEHKGEIILSSEENKGAEFRIEFEAGENALKLIPDSRGGGMKLVIDVGNTNITSGVFTDGKDSRELVCTFRMSTPALMTTDELAVNFKNILLNNKIDIRRLKEAIFCSVVPSINHNITKMMKMYFDLDILELDHSRLGRYVSNNRNFLHNLYILINLKNQKSQTITCTHFFQ